MDRSITRCQNEEWKRIRTLLSPTFSSGKLKEVRKWRTFHCHCIRLCLRTGRIISYSSQSFEHNILQNGFCSF